MTIGISFLLQQYLNDPGEQLILFFFSDLQNLGMFLIGADLNNKGLLIGENDVGASFFRPNIQRKKQSGNVRLVYG